MTSPVITSLRQLLGILQVENDALEQGRIPDAIALLPDKKAAAETLGKALEDAPRRDSSTLNEHSNSVPTDPYHEDLLEQMSFLTTRNGELLQRTINIQKHILELLIMPSPDHETQGYGHQGRYTTSQDKGNLLFVSKA